MSICSKREKCRPAQLCYYDLLDPETAESVPDDVHEHVASCADCRSDIDRLRDMLASAGRRVDSEQRRRDSAIAELLSLHFAWVDELVTCTQVKPFLPGLADPLLRVRIPTPITAHVDNCSACSGELSTLRDADLTHTQLCRLSRILADDLDADSDVAEVRAAFPPVVDMLERPDSGIATRFTFSEPAESHPGEPQTTRLIDVEVIDQRQNETAARQHVLIASLKRYVGPAIAAAAVVLLGFAMLFNGTAASALGPALLERAIRQAENIHISVFRGDGTEPTQQKWASRSQGIYMTATLTATGGQEWVLWDTANGRIKSKDTIDAVTAEVPLDQHQSTKIRKIVNSSLDLTPENMSNLPPNYRWERVADGEVLPEDRACEVYDLTWTKSEGVLRKLRYFVVPETRLPERVEFYRPFSTGGEPLLQMYMEVESLDDAEMVTAIKEARF